MLKSIQGEAQICCGLFSNATFTLTKNHTFHSPNFLSNFQKDKNTITTKPTCWTIIIKTSSMRFKQKVISFDRTQKKTTPARLPFRSHANKTKRFLIFVCVFFFFSKTTTTSWPHGKSGAYCGCLDAIIEVREMVRSFPLLLRKFHRWKIYGVFESRAFLIQLIWMLWSVNRFCWGVSWKLGVCVRRCG